jgi:group I intron endonuclease
MEVIYKITNIKNGKFYIGKTKDLERRWYEHLSLVGKKRHPLYDAILHYGVENFTIEIVDKVDASLIDELEKKWIFETKAIEMGYNMTEGGTGGDTFSNKSDQLKEITRQKLKKYFIENNPMHNTITKEVYKAAIDTPEHRKKLSNSIRDAYKNPEYRKKVSDGLKTTLQNPDLRKKWSDVKKGSLNGRCLGSVIVTDLEGVTTKYETAKEAASKLKVTAHLVREHCRNNTTFQRGVYAGWKFKFEK